MNSSSDGRTSSIGGAGRTIASVMPVSTVMNGGIGTPGFTSVSNVPRHSPPRYFTAPISVIWSQPGAAPVVSRSSATNVTWWSGVARSTDR